MPHLGPSLDQPIQLSKLLEAGLERSPDEAALLSSKGEASWSELEAVSNGLAENYLALGLKAGDRVASLMPNRIALIAHYLACFKAGLVLTPLNYRYMPPEIDHALDVSGAKIILAHAERIADLAATKAGKLPLGIIAYGPKGTSGLTFESLATASSRAFPEMAPDAPAAIFFTSGSTGPAKGVTHTVGSLGWMFASAVKSFKLSPDDVVLPASSCSHIGGFTFALSALSAGATVVVARAFDHDELGPLFRQTRPTLMSMLPTSLLHLIREHDMTPDELSSLRLCRSAGDKVPAELEKEYMAMTGHPISEGYGMTEIGLAALNPPTAVDKLGSIGVPSPGFMFSIRSEDGGEVSSGKEGRLFVRTPSRTAGYWNDPGASAEVIFEEWLDTGDVMRVDDDGYLWFCGRQKQIIVHDGSNIAPQEVEDALLAHPAVESVGVVGLRDLVHGENVRAYVALKPGAIAPKALELIKFAKARVGYKAPEEIVFLDAMPLNATGKVDRVALKALAAGDHAKVH
jgi:acyl-coenzyme A synthetase/AMP-(fatty) acid ligase